MSHSPDVALSVQDLVTSIQTVHGRIRPVDGVSFDLPVGGRIGIVGESGSGKTLTALSILRLLPEPEARLEAGRVLLHGVDLLRLSERELRKLRGAKIAMVFQEPMTALNPVMTVGSQLVETLRSHRTLSRTGARNEALEMLRLVGVTPADARMHSYPHQLSGGMRQRVMIAIALCCKPDVLLADEPTTALDVTTQAQIFDLLDGLRERMGIATVLITHDLSIVACTVDDVVVMYAGQMVERTDVRSLFVQPAHPYTKALLASTPGALLTQDRAPDEPDRRRLPTIAGRVPPLHDLPSGCRFHPRCPQATDRCRAQVPAFDEVAPRHWVRCLYPGRQT